MTIKGYQTWLTVSPGINCITLAPFMIGLGDKPGPMGTRVGVLDIVFMGFGLSLEWTRNGGNRVNRPRNDINDIKPA